MSPRNIIAFINSVRLSDGILPCSTKYQPLPPFTSSSWSFPLYFAGKNMGQSQLRHAKNVPRRNPQQAPSNPTLPLRLALPYDGPLPPPSLPSALSTSSIPVISHTMHRGHIHAHDDLGGATRKTLGGATAMGSQCRLCLLRPGRWAQRGWV